MDEMQALENAAKSSQEAKTILNGLLKVPEGYSNEGADRFVDAVIEAAVWIVADMLRKLKTEQDEKYAEHGRTNIRELRNNTADGADPTRAA